MHDVVIGCVVTMATILWGTAMWAARERHRERRREREREHIGQGDLSRALDECDAFYTRLDGEYHCGRGRQTIVFWWEADCWHWRLVRHHLTYSKAVDRGLLLTRKKLRQLVDAVDGRRRR